MSPTALIIVATHVPGIPDEMIQACADLNALLPTKLAAYTAAVAGGVQATIDSAYRDYELLREACAECARARSFEPLLA